MSRGPRRQDAAVNRELRLLMQRWCPTTRPEPAPVTSLVSAFLDAYEALADSLVACGLDRATPLDDPSVPPHLAQESWALGQLDAAVGSLVEAAGARLGPAAPPFQNVGTRCPISDASYGHVARYVAGLVGPSAALAGVAPRTEPFAAEPVGPLQGPLGG